MSLLMLSEFILAPAFEGAGFLLTLKLPHSAHAIFKLSVLEQILNSLWSGMVSEEFFQSVS